MISGDGSTLLSGDLERGALAILDRRCQIECAICGAAGQRCLASGLPGQPRHGVPATAHEDRIAVDPERSIG